MATGNQGVEDRDGGVLAGDASAAPGPDLAVEKESRTFSCPAQNLNLSGL